LGAPFAATTQHFSDVAAAHEHVVTTAVAPKLADKAAATSNLPLVHKSNTFGKLPAKSQEAIALNKTKSVTKHNRPILKPVIKV